MRQSRLTTPAYTFSKLLGGENTRRGLSV